jgi:hypothetical protein
MYVVSERKGDAWTQTIDEDANAKIIERDQEILRLRTALVELQKVNKVVRAESGRIAEELKKSGVLLE